MYYVYQIFTNISFKTYIGSTNNVDKRFKQHLQALKNKQHHSIHLQNFYNKYPNTLFYIRVLGSFDLEENCKEYEELLLNLNLTLFNVSKKACGGDLISYHPNNLLIREKLKQISTDRYPTNFNFKNYPKLGINNPNYKNGMYSQKEVFCQKCSCLLKTITATVCTSCRAKGRTEDKNPFYGRQHSDAAKRKIGEKHLGKINQSCRKQISIDSVLYPSLSLASKELGTHITTLSHRARSNNFPNIFYIQEMPNDYRTPSDEELVE